MHGHNAGHIAPYTYKFQRYKYSNLFWITEKEAKHLWGKHLTIDNVKAKTIKTTFNNRIKPRLQIKT